MIWNRHVNQAGPDGRSRCGLPGIPALAIAVLSCSCAAPRPLPSPLPCRFADGYRTQVVYLSQTVAISKRLSVLASDTQAFFTLGRAYWQKPEQATETGDRFDEWVKGTIKRVGQTADGRWLVAESEDYDWEKHKPLVYVTAIELASGEMRSASDLAALQQAVGDSGQVSTARLEPVEYFFERKLISRLVEETK